MQGEMWRGRQDDWDLLRKWAECHSVVLALVSPSPLFTCLWLGKHQTLQTLYYLGDRVLHHEHIGHVAELAEVLAQLVLAGLPTQPPDEELARSRVRGGGGASRGFPLAAQLVRARGGRGERQPCQLVHREPGEGEVSLED